MIPAGGFDPYLWLFDGAGLLIDENDDGDFPDVGIDPVVGSAYDSFLVTILPAGTYTVVLTQYGNFFSGGNGDPITDGFIREGEPTFTGDDEGGGFAGEMFVEFDTFGDPILRTGDWALDIGSSSAAVPEPSSFILLGMGSLFLVGSCVRRRKSQIISES